MGPYGFKEHNPKNARKHVNMKKGDFIRGLPKGHRPVRLPKSYGSGPLVGNMRCCDHMHTGVLWVIRMFFGHGVAKLRTCTLRLPI